MVNWIKYLRLMIKQKKAWEYRIEEIIDSKPKQTLKEIFRRSKYSALIRDYLKDFEKIEIIINPNSSHIGLTMKTKTGLSYSGNGLSIDDIFRKIFTPEVLEEFDWLLDYPRIEAFMKIFDNSIEEGRGE